MRKLTNKEIINILNNDGGIVAEEVVIPKEEFISTYQVGNIVDLGIKAEIVGLKYFENAIKPYGLIKYKLIGYVALLELRKGKWGVYDEQAIYLYENGM